MSRSYWVMSPFVLMLLGWLLILVSLPPFALASTGLFAVIPLYLLWQRVTRRNALQLGGMFGFLISVTFAWGVFAYSRLAFLAVVAVSVLFYALLFAACSRHAQSNTLWSPLHVAMCWTLVDVVASAIGIPYSYALILTQLPEVIQPAHLGGEHLVTLLVVYFQAGFASMLFTSSHALHRRRSQRKQALLLLLPIAVIAVSNISGKMTDVGTLQVAAVQTSFHPYRYVLMAADGVLKQNELELEALEKQLPSDAELVVWPELAVRGYLFRQYDAKIPSDGRYHLINALDLNNRGGKKIRSFLVDGSGHVQRVSGKEHLIPLVERSVSKQTKIYRHKPDASAGSGSANSIGDRHVNEKQAPPISPKLETSPIPLICYESTIPTASARRAASADFIIVQTSDAFAGPSLMPELGYRHAILRAVENRRYVVRSANGGVTSIIDQRGVVKAKLPMFETGVLSEAIVRYQGSTVFSKHWENWLIFFVIGGLISYLLSQPWLVDLPVGRSGGWASAVRMMLVLIVASLIVAGHTRAFSVQYNLAVSKSEKNSLPFKQRKFYTPFFANVASFDAFRYTQLRHSEESMSLFHSLAFLMRSYGHDVTGEQISQQANVQKTADDNVVSTATEREGVDSEQSVSDLIDSLTDRYGYTLSAISLEARVLPLPALARMNTGEHVVVEEIGLEEVTFFSPVNGQVRLSRAYFFDRLAVDSLLFLAPSPQPWDAY